MARTGGRLKGDRHLLILRPHLATMLCGTHIEAIYPQTRTAMPVGLESHIDYATNLRDVTCRDCIARADERRRRARMALQYPESGR